MMWNICTESYRMGILCHWINSLGIQALLKDVAYRVATGVSGFMVVYVYVLRSYWGDRGRQWLRCCATNRKVAGSIPAGVSGFFIDIKSFRSHYGPGVDSACNRNEFQEHFQGVKSGRCLRLTTYHHPVPLSRNLGTLTSWNPLGHSGPVMGLLYLYCKVTVAFWLFSATCSS